MDRIASALGDGARWRLVELLAERPRSVGELAESTGLRQPQATKHLRTLAEAGLVAVFPLGQRRVYAIETQPLAEFARTLSALVETAGAHAGERDVIARYRAAIDAESIAAQQNQWADGRRFVFDRLLAAPPEIVWRYWVDPHLLGSWWAPPSMTIIDCALPPRPGGRAVLDYRDAEGRQYHSRGRVVAACEAERLEFELSVLDTADAVLFTGNYDLALAAEGEGTRLRLVLTLGDTDIEAVPFVAGIEIGWRQVLDQLAGAVGEQRHTRIAPGNDKEA